MVRGGICSFAALSSAAAGGSAVSERPPFLLPPFDPGADPALTAADAAEKTCTPWTAFDGEKDTSSLNKGMRGGMLAIIVLLCAFGGLGVGLAEKSDANKLIRKAHMANTAGIVALLAMIGYMMVDQGYQQYSIDLVLVLGLATAHQSFRLEEKGGDLLKAVQDAHKA